MSFKIYLSICKLKISFASSSGSLLNSKSYEIFQCTHDCFPPGASTEDMKHTNIQVINW